LGLLGSDFLAKEDANDGEEEAVENKNTHLIALSRTIRNLGHVYEALA
jgi:hypothetical protein